MLQPKVYATLTAAGSGLARGIGALARNLTARPRSTIGTRFRDVEADDPELVALGRFLDRAKELYRLPLPMPFDMKTMEAETDADGNPGLDPLERRPVELGLALEARRLWIAYLNQTEAELAPEASLPTCATWRRNRPRTHAVWPQSATCGDMDPRAPSAPTTWAPGHRRRRRHGSRCPHRPMVPERGAPDPDDNRWQRGGGGCGAARPLDQV